MLGDCVPHALAEAIFVACGGAGSGGKANGGNGNGTLTSNGGDRGGLSFREVLTLLVLITRGTREEKLKCKSI